MRERILQALADYTEARFLICAIALAAVIVALFTHFLDQGHFVAALGILVGVYTAHCAIDDKLPDKR